MTPRFLSVRILALALAGMSVVACESYSGPRIYYSNLHLPLADDGLTTSCESLENNFLMCPDGLASPDCIAIGCSNGHLYPMPGTSPGECDRYNVVVQHVVEVQSVFHFVQRSRRTDGCWDIEWGTPDHWRECIGEDVELLAALECRRPPPGENSW